MTAAAATLPAAPDTTSSTKLTTAARASPVSVTTAEPGRQERRYVNLFTI